VLRPRVRVIADEQLTGASRDMVQARLDLWLTTHIEKVLAPLFALSAAEDITGMARGVAFQLVEALGVLERQKVADDVKGLDQPARASLRKYGVRFGAYHIYLPNLLKPAPRILAAQLWALKHAAPDAKGLEELRALASGGRTSIPTDKEIARPLYRTVGYRVCGERAVRVDILERLADLIRPALAWREGSPIPKPPGAVEGGGFIVTPAMTSLTGASGDDFATVLRSLGYRAERRPKPAVAAGAWTEPAAATAGTADRAETHSSAAGDALAPEAVSSPAFEELPIAESPPTEPPAIAAPEEVPPAESVGAATAPAVPTEEQAFIEVWRPGRPAERPRHRKPRRHRHPEQPTTGGAAENAVPASAEAATAQGAEPSHRKQRRQRHRPEHKETERPGKDRLPRRDSRLDRGALAKPRPQERREKVADPNSPFAKLAALKAQLEAESKERR
jgi:ATP-dependent RNA helicase SUPV3L1/SUV3